MKRIFTVALALLFLAAELCGPRITLSADAATAAGGDDVALDLFDAMQDGLVDAKFVARDSHRGRIILTNKSPNPLNIEIPEAFIGVPQVQAQIGGGMGGGGMGGGGGQQSVGGGGGGRGGGRGGGGRGGGGRGGGGRGGFSVPPEKVVRVDVPLLCLDHGLRDPSSSKPYVIRPIENYIDQPALIEIVAAYANGDLPSGAAQAAVWHLNSDVSWQELAAKQTGTDRNLVREPYFGADEIDDAMAIVAEAEELTAGQTVEPRPFELPESEGDVATQVEIAAEVDADSSEADEPSTDEPPSVDGAETAGAR